MSTLDLDTDLGCVSSDDTDIEHLRSETPDGFVFPEEIASWATNQLMRVGLCDLLTILERAGHDVPQTLLKTLKRIDVINK